MELSTSLFHPLLSSPSSFTKRQRLADGHTNAVLSSLTSHQPQVTPSAGHVKMPKNKINLNSLPLGDMPDGGLVTLPGDKIIIRDRVIIHETTENGKKVVKLYRQDNGPQQIQPAPQQQDGKQSKKRAASPSSNRILMKRQKSSTGAGSQRTAEQELRRIEINAESKRIGAENNAVSQEYAAIKLLKDQNPLDPEIARRTALNKARASEINRRGRENGDRRRALKLELNLESGDNGEEDQMQALEKAFEHFDDFSAESHAFAHSPSFTEHNSALNIFGYNDTSHPSITTVQDQYRQSYATAPGYPNHPPSFQTNTTQYSNVNSDPLPENKIHPARLSLMNSNARIPVHYSTEPKVSMKVTGENMVPLARSRLAGREAKAPMKKDKDTSESGKIQELLPGGKDDHLNSWITRQRDSPATKKEILDNTSLPSMQDKVFKSEEAIAWLDANIPLKEVSASGTRVSGELHMPPKHDDHTNQEETEPGCVHVSINQTHDLKVMTNLGLQCYHDDDEDTASVDEIPEVHPTAGTVEVCPDNINIKEEPMVGHALEKDQELDAGIKGELVTDHNSPSDQDQGGSIGIKQELRSEHQHTTTRMQVGDVSIKAEPKEDYEPVLFIETSTEVMNEAVECASDLSPRKQALGERSVNTIVVRREEVAKDMA